MEITIKNLQKKILIPQNRILKASKNAMRKLGLGNLSLSIVFVGQDRMRRVNNKYLRHDFVTDVLTFDLGPKAGEIIICPRMAVVHAREHQSSTENEIILYVIHGILHLAGYDDHSLKDIIQIRKMEKKLIK